MDFKKNAILLLTVSLIVGCSGNSTASSADGKTSTPQVEHKSLPTQYKVLDLTMGMSKQDLTQKGFDCHNLSYDGNCEIYTNPESPKNSYQKISNNGTLNGIKAFLDKNNQVYKIIITSRHTHNDNDIGQFKQTLSKLIDNNQDIEESVDVLESGYFAGAHFVSVSFTDKARLITYNTQINSKADSAASDIKNFGK